tara:strand:+ start:66 stop:878 length:813 start_codon:yes stop_codon:yes gene_type:complete
MLNSKKNPLISIIINCYNGEKYLAETIKSVLIQTYKNWEIIFYDNNSIDNSVKILKKYKDKRIKFFSNKSKNLFPLYKARNLAIKKAKGEFIAFLDVDDTWNKDKLYEQVRILKKNPMIKIFYSNYHVLFQKIKKKFLKHERKLPSGYITQDLLNEYCIGITTLLINKKIFQKYKFDENYSVIGDFDFLINLSNRFEIIATQKSLANYRIHNDNFSRNIDIYLNEMLDWKRKNKKKLLSRNFNLSKIYLLIFKLKVKLIIKKFFNINFNV